MSEGAAASITVNGVKMDLDAVFIAIGDAALVREWRRRGIGCDDDDEPVIGLTEHDFDHFRSLLLRRAIPDALWELEERLRDQDVLCAGFADEVATYYRKANR